MGLDRASARDPLPGKEFVEPAVWRPGDAVEHIGEPGLGIDIVELGRADESVHGGRAHAAAVGAGEQPGASAQGDTTKAALSGIV